MWRSSEQLCWKGERSYLALYYSLVLNFMRYHLFTFLDESLLLIGLNLPHLLFVFRELKEARLAATSPHQASQPGSLPRAGRKLVGKSAARSMSFGFPGY